MRYNDPDAVNRGFVATAAKDNIAVRDPLTRDHLKVDAIALDADAR